MWVIYEYTIMTNIIDLRIQPPPHVMCFLSPPRREASLRFDPKNSILKTSICPEFRHRFRMATLLSNYLFIYLFLSSGSIKAITSTSDNQPVHEQHQHGPKSPTSPHVPLSEASCRMWILFPRQLTETQLEIIQMSLDDKR